jgi:small subunit ribosomal protein S16
MVKIRLRRTGAKKKPTYRVVVAESRTPRDGRFIEIIGHYNPRTEPVTFNIHEDRVLHWLSAGAQPTDPVRRLLDNAGTLDRFARLKAGEDLDKLLVEAQASREKNQQMVETAPVDEKKSPVQPEIEEEAVEVAEESAETPPAEVETVEESAEAPEEVVVEPEEDAAAETDEED